MEVCLDRLEADLVGVDVDGLDDVGLLPYDGETPGGPVVDGLGLDADLGDVELEIDVTLTDLYFRWKHAPGKCQLRPQRAITSTNPEFEAWSTCSGLGLNISAPSARIDSYAMDFVRSADQEGTAVDGAHTADISLTGIVHTSTRVGQCDLAAINPVVEDLGAGRSPGDLHEPRPRFRAAQPAGPLPHR